MERGPLALFGAIIAIGLGPAMWLGAQFGESTLTPQRPPAVTVQQNEVIPPQGGTGAGDTPTDPAQLINSDTQAGTAPRQGKPKAAPTTTTSPPTSTPEKSTAPTDDPATSEPPTDDVTTEPDDPGPSPTESTTEPTEDPSDEPSDEPSDPDVPTTEVTTADDVTASYGNA
jgi:hypothetical protein